MPDKSFTVDEERARNPNLRRWMVFVDGENFAIRAKNVAKDKGLDLPTGEFYEPDVFVWIPNVPPREDVLYRNGTRKEWNIKVELWPVRSHYYTSVSGDEVKVANIRTRLKNLGFHPEVFKKTKGERSKGVDIALAKDLLSHAFLNNL